MVLAACGKVMHSGVTISHHKKKSKGKIIAKQTLKICFELVETHKKLNRQLNHGTHAMTSTSWLCGALTN